MHLTLSPHRLKKARVSYNLFNALNTVSWTFLAGNIITLFALRLEASSTLVGALTAINYGAFFFLFLGRMFARRIPIIKIFVVTWTLRSVAMVPLLFAPFFSESGHNKIAIVLMLLGVTIFHVTRGIGMVGNNPVLSFLAQGQDRGSYMTLIQVINNGVGMLSTFALALFLGSESPLFVYSLIMAAGIVIGIASALVFARIPEPDSSEKAIDRDFFSVIRGPLAEPPLRFFIAIMLLVCMVSGIVRTFILVYAREVFYQGDGMVTLYTVFGSFGSLVVGLIIKFLIDRVGAKPIYVLCTIFGVISLVPALVFPAPAGVDPSGETISVTAILYLSALFFIINFAFLGAEGVGQTYFLGLVPRKCMLDMSIVYYFVYAIAGAGGTFLAGILLDVLKALSFSYFAAFRALHIMMAVFLIVVLALQKKLTSLGAIPLTAAINLLFSPRDLRAIALMDKLGKSRGAGEEEEVLEELSETASPFALKAILEKLHSPRFSVRAEALHALYALEKIDAQTAQTLLDDLRRNTHTTAYISARVLGKHKVFDSLPLLRQALHSGDYMLAGEAMIALSRLGAQDFFPEVAQIIRETDNPRLKIMGFEALAVQHDPSVLPVLIDCLLEKENASHIKDEAALTLASILDVGNLYYKLLVKSEEDPSSCDTLARDEAESAFEYYRSLHGAERKRKTGGDVRETQAETLLKAVSAFIGEASGKTLPARNGRDLSQWILALPPSIIDKKVQLIMAEAVLDETLAALDCFRLLSVQWVSRILRLWARHTPGAD